MADDQGYLKISSPFKTNEQEDITNFDSRKPNSLFHNHSLNKSLPLLPRYALQTPSPLQLNPRFKLHPL